MLRMKNLKIFLLFASMICIYNESAAQASCATYHRRLACKGASKSGFIYNSSSKSGSFAKGQSSRYEVAFHSGFDYSITICADPILGNQIGLVLTKSPTDELLYDNATDNKANHTIFSCKETCRAFIAVTIPGPAPIKGKPAETGCLGILIEQKPTHPPVWDAAP
jgi:hypothetical protein